MNGAEVLLRTLVANDVDVCFMNPGTSEMQFVAALDRVPQMRAVLCLFEGVCSGAADGFARMTGRPASTLLHLGPGLANGLANFHNARKAKSPVVSIVGEHSTTHLQHDAPLTADIDLFARTVSTCVFRPSRAGELGSLAAEAIAAARYAPGQVSHLIVPADFSWSEAGEPGPVIPLSARPAPASSRIAEARQVLSGGRRTGLLLSGSALHERGLEAAARVAEAHGVRVFANRNAARMESGRGRFQPQRIAYFPEPAEEMLGGLDDLILVESKTPVSFFGYPGRRSTLAPEGCRIHTLAREDEDGTAALEALSPASAGRVSSTEPASLPPDGPLTPDTVGRVVAALLPDGSIVSDEAISAGEAIWRHLLHAGPHSHLPVTGGSIGQALPVATGAAVACPDRKVVALQADGGGMYTLQSLWTMARESLDVTVVILANRRYQILDVEMRRTGANGFCSRASAMIDIGKPDLDWVRISEGMGVASSRATSTTEFAREFDAAMREKGPRLIEALIASE